MNRISLLLLAACLAHADDPERVIMQSSESLPNGIVVHFTTAIEPPLKNSQFLALGGGISMSNDRIHRSMFDKTGGVYFGYNLGVEPAGPPKSYRVVIEPLSGDRISIHTPAGELLTRPAAIPKYPPPQIVQEGDTLALDLLVSPDGAQKMVDYIRISSFVEPGAATMTSPPRDFTLDDGPLDLKFPSPTRFWINGQAWQGLAGFTVKPGATVWFAVPNRGRYILSLAPRDGFQKAGTVRGHVLAFQDGGDRYEYRASGPILGRAGAWNLYVLHDPLYQPKPTPQPAVSGGIDRLENLLPQR
jgi:hypothetical protein